jgi:hypothetical protein
MDDTVACKTGFPFVCSSKHTFTIAPNLAPSQHEMILNKKLKTTVQYTATLVSNKAECMIARTRHKPFDTVSRALANQCNSRRPHNRVATKL